MAKTYSNTCKQWTCIWGLGSLVVLLYLGISYSHSCSIVPVPFQVQGNAGILPVPWHLSREGGSTFLFSDSLHPLGDVLSTFSPKLRRAEQKRSPLLRDPPKIEFLSPLWFFSPSLVKWPFYLVSEAGKLGRTNVSFHVFLYNTWNLVSEIPNKIINFVLFYFWFCCPTPFLRAGVTGYPSC